MQSRPDKYLKCLDKYKHYSVKEVEVGRLLAVCLLLRVDLLLLVLSASVHILLLLRRLIEIILLLLRRITTNWLCRCQSERILTWQLERIADTCMLSICLVLLNGRLLVVEASENIWLRRNWLWLLRWSRQKIVEICIFRCLTLPGSRLIKYIHQVNHASICGRGVGLWLSKKLICCFRLCSTLVKTIKVEISWCLIFLSPTYSTEITFTNKFHQVNISISLQFLSCSSGRLKFIKNSAIEIIFLVTVIAISILTFLRSLKLVTIHTASDFFGNFSDLTGIVGSDYYSECLHQVFLWIVKVRQLDRKVE